ncbi:MAG: CCA tRNA nucleotidyltransferase [Candidatus Puniceispirillaceae bacterium]
MAARKMETDGATDRVTAPFPIPPLAARLFTIAATSGYEARIVGGAVRDWLAGREIGDIDMAIAAPIDRAAALFRDAGLKVIDTGLEHGTVTVVDDGQHLEVTQTRVDLETDGRHAIVAFSDDWAADAARRDFTINALYADAGGQIEDPLGGQADLEAGVLRFVGVATQRVEEDALRMLRYCRFLPHFGRAGIDQEALAALADKAGLAAMLSGERIAAELRRMLGAPGARTGIGLMQDTGLANAALGVALDAGRLTPEIDQLVEDGIGDEGSAWLVRLAVIAQPGDAASLSARLRLSRRDSHFLVTLDRDQPEADVGSLTGTIWQQSAWWLWRAGSAPAACLVVAGGRAGRQIEMPQLARLAAWVPPEFPLAGADLLSHGVDSGPALGEMLRTAEREWVDRGFVPTRAELLVFLGLDPVA